MSTRKYENNPDVFCYKYGCNGLAFGLKARILWHQEHIFHGMNTEKKIHFFYSHKDSLVYCNNINELMQFYDIEQEPTEWRLFIGLSKSSLDAVLLHNRNVYVYIPVGHPAQTK